MLELASVDAGYGAFQALVDVSLEIRNGEAVAVIGPNGAGKTTLMRVISGLIRPMRGAITMEGADLLATPHAAPADPLPPLAELLKQLIDGFRAIDRFQPKIRVGVCGHIVVGRVEEGPRVAQSRR